MDIKTFTKNFEKLRARKFVQSTRKGPTGIGHTLEHYLGITENNIALPDIGEAELKAHRARSNNLITLFTFNRKAWQVKPLEAVKKYGSLDRKGRLGLYYTLGLKPNSAGLFAHIDDNNVSVRHIDGEVIISWKLENLQKRFEEKIPALIIVYAETEERDGVEWFWFNRAKILKGTTTDILLQQLQQENILIDLRLHDKGTRARNHGTGFRAFEKNLDKLFSEIKDL